LLLLRGLLCQAGQGLFWAAVEARADLLGVEQQQWLKRVDDFSHSHFSSTSVSSGFSTVAGSRGTRRSQPSTELPGPHKPLCILSCYPWRALVYRSISKQVDIRRYFCCHRQILWNTSWFPLCTCIGSRLSPKSWWNLKCKIPFQPHGIYTGSSPRQRSVWGYNPWVFCRNRTCRRNGSRLLLRHIQKCFHGRGLELILSWSEWILAHILRSRLNIDCCHRNEEPKLPVMNFYDVFSVCFRKWDLDQLFPGFTGGLVSFNIIAVRS